MFVKGFILNKFFLLFFLSFCTLFANDKLIIKYPLTSQKIERYEYQLSAIKFILNKAEVDYELRASEKIYTQARAIKELKKGKDLNLFWMGTSPQVEEELTDAEVKKMCDEAHRKAREDMAEREGNSTL